jgi:hypothetical protein
LGGEVGYLEIVHTDMYMYLNENYQNNAIKWLCLCACMLVIHSLTDSHQIYTKQYLHSKWEETNTKFVVFGLTWRGTKPQTFTIEANTITLAIYTKCTVCICRHYLNNHLIALFSNIRYIRNHIMWIDMSLHSDTLPWFWANQSLLFLLNTACWAEKQEILL